MKDLFEGPKSPEEMDFGDMFRLFDKAEELPEDLKEEVFNTMDTIRLTTDLVDLFFGKQLETDLGLLELFTENDFDKE